MPNLSLDAAFSGRVQCAPQPLTVGAFLVSQDGTFYWVNYPLDGSEYLFGAPGGTWRAGLTSLTLGDMADSIGW